MIFDRSQYLKEPLPIERELKILFNEKDQIVIFDIGACEGEDSIKYSRLFKNAQVFAFEPLPNNVTIIKENLTTYDIRNVIIHNKALSNIAGAAEFHVSNGKPEEATEADWDYGNKSSSLLPPDKHNELASFIKFDQKITVETTTINEFCKNNNIDCVDYIHMDVQGAELMVLQGAESFIKSIKVIWLEVSNVHVYKDQPLANEIEFFMVDNGFVLVKDCVEGIQGDQLYIAKKFFPKHQDLRKKLNSKNITSVTRILRQLGFK